MTTTIRFRFLAVAARKAFAGRDTSYGAVRAFIDITGYREWGRSLLTYTNAFLTGR